MARLNTQRAFASVFLALALHASHAAPVELAGVKIEDKLDLGGSTLVLNGAGIRYKAIFKVYTAGLYLTRKASTPDTVLATPGAKRLAVTLLRDIDAEELGRLFLRGVSDNTPKNQMAQLLPGLLRISKVFTDQKQLKTGDTFSIDWIPGSGTVMTINNVKQGDPVKEQAFFDALMRIWLGPSPADWKLKELLLGQAN